ncbi:bifunctional diguanylate cyclase/phosphodiesterase [Actinokineospora sp. UTMC 2448]|uniref:putative bifunctional diguanylate cyclase/phosphodiesterase n=1 Tax=Actinokineospora sp. UTMC 2448 TaxID=2268449 RepID=UPI0021644428|nr:EAL domain-containing protein [Actinokineospora sp. UTMC 2448]UVS78650.1 Cyclic di-GMP phosphodiesterase Gmr [Actinokineospora sp. UTMC 2448]
MSQPGSRPDPRPDGGRARELLARKWAYLLSGVAVIPLAVEELEHELREQIDALCAAAASDPVDTAAAERVGDHVVGLGYVGEDGLRRTVEVLGKGLPALPGFQRAEQAALVIGALAAGFLVANRRVVFEQQERMQLSLLKAVRDAKWHLKESEARFDSVVTSSASGIMIVGLDGRLVRTNAAVAEILGRTPAELTGATLFDLVHPDTVGMLREAMRAVAEGGQDRVRQSQRLLRKDGDVARISLTASLLRDPDGAPSHFVAVVEDGTELMLLQSELHRQALHDVLTGLPNRQFFGTHLESAVRRADPVHGVTLLHLDLDGFGMVCDSLGWLAGERLLVHVAQQLKSVLAREKAMVARFDGDEFGILVENTATTPNTAALAAAINRALAEPVYVDGHGLAVSASMGVVRGVSRNQEPAELLRAADQALRRARRGRRGQWELFDPGRDTADRSALARAVAMPGAWEQGEFTVRYRPVVRLADGGVAGAEAVLRWDRRDGRLPHERCVALAERTGFILPLGEWLLTIAAGQVRWWQRDASAVPLSVALTAHQATDADLVSRVVRVLDATGLPADRLAVAVPSAVVTAPDVADNLGVLAEMGVRTALRDLALGPDDVAAVRDLGVHSVRVAARLVELQSRADAAYVGALLPALAETGAVIGVDGVVTEEQAAWWREAGAELGTGPLFGPDHSAAGFHARLRR